MNVPFFPPFPLFLGIEDSNGLYLALLDFYLEMVDVGIGMKLWNSPWCLGLNGKLGLDHWLLLSPLPCCLSACHFSRKHGNFGCCTAQTNEFLLGQEGSSRKQIQNITEMTFPSKYLGKL